MTEKYTVIVVGRGEFPRDMLRYDGARPRTPADAEAIERSVPYVPRSPYQAITLVCERVTSERWQSFGWCPVWLATEPTERSLKAGLVETRVLYDIPEPEVQS